MKPLTQAEEEVMQLLWKLKKAFVWDLIEALPDPKPAYNTVSTIVRILEKKGFVSYEAYGKSHQYRPLITKEAYTQKYLNRFVDRYFSGSYQQLVSFFTREEKMSIKDLEKLLDELKNKEK